MDGAPRPELGAKRPIGHVRITMRIVTIWIALQLVHAARKFFICRCRLLNGKWQGTGQVLEFALPSTLAGSGCNEIGKSRTRPDPGSGRKAIDKPVNVVDTFNRSSLKSTLPSTSPSLPRHLAHTRCWAAWPGMAASWGGSPTVVWPCRCPGADAPSCRRYASGQTPSGPVAGSQSCAHCALLS